MEFFEPALVFRGDVAQSLFVVGDGADRAKIALHGAALDERRLQVHPLRHRGIDLDVVLGGGVFAFVNGHHVHAHRVLGGLLADLAGNHGRLVVFDLALARGRGRFSTPGGVGADRLKFHAADRAVARLVPDDLRMHAAGVELFFRGAQRRREKHERAEEQRGADKGKAQEGERGQFHEDDHLERLAAVSRGVLAGATSATISSKSVAAVSRWRSASSRSRRMPNAISCVCGIMPGPLMPDW